LIFLKKTFSPHIKSTGNGGGKSRGRKGRTNEKGLSRDLGGEGAEERNGWFLGRELESGSG